MKMLKLMFTMLAIALFLPMAALADNETTSVEVDSDTQAEVAIAKYTHGAQVRLAQLERSIARNIAKGEVIIERIAESTDADVTALVDIIAEMEALQAQVAAEIETDTQGEDAVETFVALKQDAIGLSQEFRETVHDIIPEEEREEIRAQAQARAEIRAQELKEKVAQRVHTFNAERLRNLMDMIGSVDSELAAQVEAGDITAQEALTQVRAQLANLTPEERQEIHAQIREETSARAVFARAKAERATIQARQEAAARIRARVDMLDNERIRERVSNALDIAQERLGRWEDRVDRVESRIRSRISGGASAGADAQVNAGARVSAAGQQAPPPLPRANTGVDARVRANVDVTGGDQ